MKIVRTEAVVQGCSVKKVSWKFCKTLAQVFSCEFCEIFKNTSFYVEHLRWLLLYILSFTVTVFFLITHNYILMFVLVKLLKWENIVFECIYKFSDKNNENKAWVFGRNT